MPTLQELQALEREQDKARLRTLLIEFNATLKRLPTLHREAKGWLDTDGVDWKGLAVRLEPQLVAAAQWFLRYDRLSRVVQQQPRLLAYQQHLIERATARTLAELLHLSVQEEKTAIDAVEAERTKKEQEQAEARRKAEVNAEIERTKKEQEQAEARRKAEVNAEIERRKKEQEQAEARRKAEAKAAEEARQKAANEARRRAEEKAASRAKEELEQKRLAKEARRQRLESFGYVDNDDGTITDKNNNLMWKKDLEVGGARSWEETMKHFSGLNKYAGHNDWRVPTVDELKTLLQTQEAFNTNESRVDVWSSTKQSFTSIVVFNLIIFCFFVLVYLVVVKPWVAKHIWEQIAFVFGSSYFIVALLLTPWIFSVIYEMVYEDRRGRVTCYTCPWYINFANNSVASYEIQYPLPVRLVRTCK